MAIPNGTKQELSDHWASLALYASLHLLTGGGTDGSNEASGGGYAREALTYTPGTTGVNTSDGVEVFCAAGSYTEGGVWSADTAGTFHGSGPFSGGTVVVVGTGASITVTVSLSIL